MIVSYEIWKSIETQKDHKIRDLNKFYVYILT